MSRNVHGHCGLENRAGKNDPPGGCLVSCGFIFGLRREARCVEYGIMAVRHMNSAELNASLKYLLTNYTNRVFNLLSGLHIMNVEQVIRRTSGMEVARMNNAIPMNAANALEAGKKRPGRKAAEFDRNPDYTLDNMILLDHLEKQTVYDDAGPTALDGLVNALEDCGPWISVGFRKKAESAVEAARQ
jgi:hypothetical protein